MNDLALELIPGILESDWAAAEAKLNILKPFVRPVHIDLIDGKFAPNTTFLDPAPFKKFSEYFYLELHMMVDNPVQYLQPFAQAGFKRFIGHVEKMPDQVEFVAKAQFLGEVGLAIDAQTPIEKIRVAIDDLDFILVMTVQAGSSGQEFLSDCLEKIKAIRAKTDITIEVDGGINETTILQARAAGANRFVETSNLFASQDPMKHYRELQKLIQE